jgi:hypothetical protein
VTAAHYVVAEYVVLRCRCGVEVAAESEERAERLMAEHLVEHKDKPPA